MKSELYRAQDGVEYRDLNKNGRMDSYEDPRIPTEKRVDNLRSIEDKPDEPGFACAAVTQITDQKMNHFNLWQIFGEIRKPPKATRYGGSGGGGVTNLRL